MGIFSLILFLAGCVVGLILTYILMRFSVELALKLRNKTTILDTLNKSTDFQEFINAGYTYIFHLTANICILVLAVYGVCYLLQPNSTATTIQSYSLEAFKYVFIALVISCVREIMQITEAIVSAVVFALMTSWFGRDHKDITNKEQSPNKEPNLPIGSKVMVKTEKGENVIGFVRKTDKTYATIEIPDKGWIRVPLNEVTKI